MVSESKDEFKETSFLIDVGTLITLLVAMFYTAGWSFAYHYFEKFHLGLIGLDIPKEYLFMYSFHVIRDQLFLSFSALLSAIVLYFLVKFCFKKARKAMGREPSEQGINKNIFKNIYKNRQYELFLGTGLLLTPVMIFLMFWQFYNLGTLGASGLYEKQALNDFESYPRVRVFLKAVPDKFKEKAEEWENGCYKLLLKNKDRLYLFKPQIYKKDNPKNISYTDIIPQSDVKAVRVLPLYNKCTE